MNQSTLITAIQTTAHADRRVYCMIVYAGIRPTNVPVTDADTGFLVKLANRYPLAPTIRYEHHDSLEVSPPSANDAPITIILWPDPSSEDIIKLNAAYIAAWRNQRAKLRNHIGSINYTLNQAGSSPPDSEHTTPADAAQPPHQAPNWGAPPTIPPWSKSTTPTTPPQQQLQAPKPPNTPTPTPEPNPISVPHWLNKVFTKSFMITAGTAVAAGILLYVIYRAAA